MQAVVALAACATEEWLPGWLPDDKHARYELQPKPFANIGVPSSQDEYKAEKCLSIQPTRRNGTHPRTHYIP